MDVGLKTYQDNAEKENRDRLITENLGFVKQVLGRLIVDLPNSADFDNLESAGILGLVEAATRFDADHGVRFKTFAYSRIRGAILDELRRNCPLPQTILQQWSLIREAWNEIAVNANAETLAKATGLSVREVEDTLVAVRLTRPKVWHEELPVRRYEPAVDEQPLSGESDQSRLADAIEKLPEQLRVVVTLYHLEELTLKEIGHVLSLSESRVSRILAAAELQLKCLVREVD